MARCEAWATEANLCSPCDDYSLDSALMDEMLEIASDILFYATAQQFPGECTETIRPCSSSYSTGYYANLNIPGRLSPNGYGYGFHTCSCGTPDSCGCPPLHQIRLPRDNVSDITAVKIDGATLATTAYRLDPPNLLVLLGDLTVPCCRNLELADTQPDTWSVAYTYGLAPPSPLIRAAAILACELYQSCNPEGFETECRLPRNIASLARQGVTVTFQLIDQLFTAHPGRPISFGIPEIDMAVAMFNPNGLMAPSVIVSPDDPDIARIVGS